MTTPLTDSGTENAELQEIPSRRETLGEALGGMFMGGSGLSATLTLALGLASLGWLADSLLPFLQESAAWVVAQARGQSFETHFADNLIKLVLPLLWFCGLGLFLYLRQRARTAPRVYQAVVPQPQRGLIVMLSKYSRFADKTALAAEISQAIDTETLNLEQVMSGCNWGPLAFAVKYHAPVLEKCWIIVTAHSPDKKDGSEDEFDAAAKLVNFLARDYRSVVCEKLIVRDANDIGQAAQAISSIYRSLTQPGTTLQPQQVIADFTSGTAAMSGGMILATLDEGREIEYVTRRKPLSPEFTARDIREQQLIISPRTSLRLAETLTRRK